MNAKALRVRREERQVTLRIWKEWLSESSKGEWTRLLIHNHDAWLERGHRQMNFYLTQVMSGHEAYNTYLFRMKLAKSPRVPTAIEEGKMMTPGTPCSITATSDIIFVKMSNLEPQRTLKIQGEALSKKRKRRES